MLLFGWNRKTEKMYYAAFAITHSIGLIIRHISSLRQYLTYSTSLTQDTLIWFYGLNFLQASLQGPI